MLEPYLKQNPGITWGRLRACVAMLPKGKSVKKRTFIVKAIWDDEAKVFYSESDIVGLHIEAETLEEFEEVMHENAFDLVVANHIKPQELVKKKLSDLIPTIFWEKDMSGVAAA